MLSSIHQRRLRYGLFDLSLSKSQVLDRPQPCLSSLAGYIGAVGYLGFALRISKMFKVPLIEGKSGRVPHGSRSRVVWRISEHVALVDDDDAERVLTLRWRYCVNRSRGDISVVAQRATLLHRFILNAPKGTQVDHRDGDRLNCQRLNLRFVTHSQNLQNTRLRTNGTVTGFKGVTHIPNRKNTPNRYTAKIRWQGKRLHLGWFRTAEEAAHVYDAKARDLFGEFACLNFPRDGEQSVRRHTNKGALL